MQEKILKKARSSELRGEQEELNQKRLTSSKRKKENEDKTEMDALRKAKIKEGKEKYKIQDN